MLALGTVTILQSGGWGREIEQLAEATWQMWENAELNPCPGAAL